MPVAHLEGTEGAINGGGVAHVGALPPQLCLNIGERCRGYEVCCQASLLHGSACRGMVANCPSKLWMVVRNVQHLQRCKDAGKHDSTNAALVCGCYLSWHLTASPQSEQGRCPAPLGADQGRGHRPHP